ncbi:lactate utilization protein [Collinsella intestinalis]|uniref:Lactate utilization protein n=1 Tax=Collinsella intestinalis TaxID=147207 RepID=A0A414NG21_9ACTN|nr:lactate utilization protein [Collinsella intestinalis]RHF38651.1 lactate utilization protein [Collinsella intestinalis]
MEDVKRTVHRTTAEHIIKKLAIRNMTGHYRDTAAEAVELARDLVEPGQSVTWGGSVSFSESGIKAALEADGHRMIDRSQATTPEEQDAMWREQVGADWFFMGTNAITLDGELVNIDGNANRLALLLHGPKHVCVIAGMNKVVADVESGLKRIRTVTCPLNAARLHTGTPCELAGVCSNCHAEKCMCCQEVITRHSRHDGRIHVILVGEDLGF